MTTRRPRKTGATICRPRQPGHWLAKAATAYHTNSRRLIGSISKEVAAGNISSSKAKRLIVQVETQWSRTQDFLDKVGEEVFAKSDRESGERVTAAALRWRTSYRARAK